MSGKNTAKGTCSPRQGRSRPWVLTMEATNGVVYRMGRYASEAAAKASAEGWQGHFPRLTPTITHAPSGVSR